SGRVARFLGGQTGFALHRKLHVWASNLQRNRHQMLLLFSRRDVTVAAVAEWSRYQIVVGLVTSWSPVPPKTRRVGERCTLNPSRAQTSSRWCGVVVRKGGVPAQVSSTALDHCSKLRGPSPKALV
ncbi:uncharacterized protein TNCV_620901, partial [Trichonephila clavipes]